MSLPISVEICAELENTDKAKRLRERFPAEKDGEGLVLRLSEDGLSLVSGSQKLKGDFTRMLPRITGGKLAHEFLLRAAKIKDREGPLTAIDATAGLGEDSLILAAAGFNVRLFEKNPVVCELLSDALERASKIDELSDIVSRMELFNADSIEAMKVIEESLDVILLDPMFPARQKSALVKKKLQVIQKLEMPCCDEREMLLAAMNVGPKKLIVKRPPKGPFLADIKPDYSITGKAVRFDCFVSPLDKIHKYK